MRTRPLVRRPWFRAVAGLMVAAWGCSPPTRPTADLAAKVPVVRILLLTNLTTVRLSAARAPTARFSGDSAARPVDLPPSTAVAVARAPHGWRVGATTVGSGELTIVPAADSPLSVAGRAYRGRLRLVPRGSDAFDVVNDVDVESYLGGVVAKEMLPTFGAEAYRAQAVVARTYALYRARTAGPSARYDMTDDTHDQVYGGVAGETARALDAVRATDGTVVAYGPPGEERIFKAYFSSCCGGVGQSAADAFGDPPSATLSAQSNGRRCATSPWFNWPPIVIPRGEFTRRLRRFGQVQRRPEENAAGVVRVDVTGRNEFGRPERFAVIDARDRSYSLVAEDLRHVVNTDLPPGATRAPSSFFDVQVTATDVRLVNGHGSGHGVGLCQWCAQAKSQAGVGYQQIVLDAYPQAVLLKAF